MIVKSVIKYKLKRKIYYRTLILNKIIKSNEKYE